MAHEQKSLATPVEYVESNTSFSKKEIPRTDVTSLNANLLFNVDNETNKIVITINIKSLDDLHQ